jgi:hypothetical protein
MIPEFRISRKAGRGAPAVISDSGGDRVNASSARGLTGVDAFNKPSDAGEI